MFVSPTKANQIQEPETNPMSLSELELLDIRHYVKDKHIKVLKAGEDEFITLLKEETTGFPKGIALIVPEMNQPVQKQAAVNSLYDQLNNYGWTNLLITAPSVESTTAMMEKAITEEAEKAEQTVQTKAMKGDSMTAESGEKTEADPNLVLKSFHIDDYYSETELEAIQSNFEQRLTAGFKLAEEYPGFYLIICQGKSCNWVTELVLAEKIQTPDAMVMLSAHMPQDSLNDNFSEQVSKTEFPVLDLYQTFDNAWVETSIKMRRMYARKNYKTDYRQRKLHSSYDYQGQQRRTIKEIYGFLTAVGM